MINSQISDLILINETNENIHIPLKLKPDDHSIEEDSKNKYLPPNVMNNKIIGKKERERINNISEDLVISKKSGVKISNNILKLYNYEPLQEKGKVTISSPPVQNNIFHIITNKTARRIRIKTLSNEKKGELVIPAFGKRRVSISNLNKLEYMKWEQLNLITVEEEEPFPPKSTNWWIYPFAWIGYGWIVVLLYKLIAQDKEIYENIDAWWLWPAGAIIIGIIAGGYKFLFLSKKGEVIQKVVMKTINMSILLLFGPIGLPIIIVLLFGGVAQIWQQLNFFALPTYLLYRFIELIIIILLSILPGILYFQFERRTVKTLRIKFIRDIMILNPSIHTEDDAEIIYGNQVDEVTGSIGFNIKQFAMLTKARPIFLATLLITILWICTLWPIGEIEYDDDISKILVPKKNIITFVFLGAYFFALNLIFRRYARGDLTPKAYSHIIVRILSSIIIVWVVDVVWVGDVIFPVSSKTDNLLFLIAFGIGIVPETGIAFLKNIARRIKLEFIFPSLSVKHPICELEGISLYDQARFLEEGVESVENLAHHNLIELMLRSGVTTSRLVDLVDQAILYLHVVGEVELSEKEKRKGIDILRENGIRTATDLLCIEEAINNPSKSNDKKKILIEDQFFYTLINPYNDSKSDRMHIVLQSIKDDEWLSYVKNWRKIYLNKEIINDPEEFYLDEEC